jgi:hypothetical protein
MVLLEKDTRSEEYRKLLRAESANLNVLNAEWTFLFQNEFSASPLAGDGKVYLLSEEGETTVLRDGPEFEVLKTNPLNEYTLASPAALGGQLFIRTAKHLFDIGEKAGKRTGGREASPAAAR